MPQRGGIHLVTLQQMLLLFTRLIVDGFDFAATVSFVDDYVNSRMVTSLFLVNNIGVPVNKFLVNLFYSSAKMIKNTCWAQVPIILNVFIFGLKKLQWLADLDYAFSLSTGTAKNPADVRLIMH
ncbi:hypothetical protein NC651_012648 [Populus alba x Populus x berolinensis]|nr:hypothetical protein NC651_012648 [Populus alba x Populus x berolinensis]